MRLTTVILSAIVLTACSNNGDKQFVGSWNATFDKKESIIVRFNKDGTFHFELDEEKKPFGGVYYVLPNENVVALDNRESYVNEDAVGKYRFINADNFELLFLGLNDTTKIEFTRIKR